jgi:hypothetical protein
MNDFAGLTPALLAGGGIGDADFLAETDKTLAPTNLRMTERTSP